MTPIALSPQDLIARLAVLRGAGPAAAAFDADGTLWAGDVGEDVFEHFVAEGLLQQEAREPLCRLAGVLGLDDTDDLETAARSILDASRAGFVDRQLAYEALTWAYAGHRATGLEDDVRNALESLDMPGRRQPELQPVLDFCRHEEVLVCVVSASPRRVVQAALTLAGIDVDHVVGGEPAVGDGRILPRMAEPLPYGPAKVTALRSRVGGAAWLASFGDSDADLPMLEAAAIGVMVRPTRAMRRAAHRAPTVVELAAPERAR